MLYTPYSSQDWIYYHYKDCIRYPWALGNMWLPETLRMIVLTSFSQRFLIWNKLKTIYIYIYIYIYICMYVYVNIQLIYWYLNLHSKKDLNIDYCDKENFNIIDNLKITTFLPNHRKRMTIPPVYPGLHCLKVVMWWKNIYAKFLFICLRLVLMDREHKVS